MDGLNHLERHSHAELAANQCVCVCSDGGKVAVARVTAFEVVKRAVCVFVCVCVHAVNWYMMIVFATRREKKNDKKH